MFNIPFVQKVLSLLHKNTKERQILIEAKYYERYSETNTPGICLTQAEQKELDKEIKILRRNELIKLMSDDRNALNDLLHSEGWRVFLKYIEGMKFDIPENCSVIEKLALEKAKEQAVNAILSIPDKVVEFYDKETGEIND